MVVTTSMAPIAMKCSWSQRQAARSSTGTDVLIISVFLYDVFHVAGEITVRKLQVDCKKYGEDQKHEEAAHPLFDERPTLVVGNVAKTGQPLQLFFRSDARTCARTSDSIRYRFSSGDTGATFLRNSFGYPGSTSGDDVLIGLISRRVSPGMV